MKKVLCLLTALALALALTGAVAEEFFAEESFGGETFFAEEDFFTEEDLFVEEMPEEDFTEEAAPEEPDELEDRTIIAIATDDELTATLGQDWEIAPVITSAAATKKANQVKITWTHTNADGQTIKLPKNTQYYVYEIDGETGVAFQRAKTTKKSVTLKNQAYGLHLYFVRAEQVKKGAELYGNSSEVTDPVDVVSSTMWKKIQSMKVYEEASDNGQDLVIRILVNEIADAYNISFKGSLGKAFGIKWSVGTYIWGKIKSVEIPSDEFDWKDVPSGSGYKYEGELSINNSSTLQQQFDGESDWLAECELYTEDGEFAKNLGHPKNMKVTTQPIWWDEVNEKTLKGSKKTVNVKKLYYDEAANTSVAPIIDLTMQCGPAVFVTWTHEQSEDCKYIIYDGKKEIGRTEEGEYSFMGELTGKGKAGTHKITVQPLYGETKGKKSAAKSLKVIKGKKTPVTGILGPDDNGKASLMFFNSNPAVKEFFVSILDADGNVLASKTISVDSAEMNVDGYDLYGWDTDLTGTCLATIQSYTGENRTGTRYTSDLYITADALYMPLKR